MTPFKTFAAAAAVAALGLAAADMSASAQDLTNGPKGMQPNRLSSRTMAGKQPSRAMMMPHHTMHHHMHRHMSFRYGYHHMHHAMARPLVVRPVAPIVAAVPVAPAPSPFVAGPLGLGSDILAAPFRTLGAIFPATGDVATNPLVIIGAPLHAIGDLAQAPLRIVGAPFGASPAGAY